MQGESVDIHAIDSGRKTTVVETTINFLKGNIGAGFLSLPFAFAHCGYIGAR
jgi:amino acid permease